MDLPALFVTLPRAKRPGILGTGVALGRHTNHPQIAMDSDTGVKK